MIPAYVTVIGPKGSIIAGYPTEGPSVGDIAEAAAQGLCGSDPTGAFRVRIEVRTFQRATGRHHTREYRITDTEALLVDPSDPSTWAGPREISP